MQPCNHPTQGCSRAQRDLRDRADLGVYVEAAAFEGRGICPGSAQHGCRNGSGIELRVPVARWSIIATSTTISFLDAGLGMPFLSGSLGFERFRVSGFDAEEFGEEQLKKLILASCSSIPASSNDAIQVGFIGGDHLFDQTFDLGKNLINDALHCGIRIDTNQIPSAIRRAWLQIELAARAQESSNGRLTKAMRQEAKEAVEQRCEVEAATGKYRKMQQFPLLWDLRNELLYFGGSGTAAGHVADLIERTFEVELSRVSAGSLALDWGRRVDRAADVDDLFPVCFTPDFPFDQLAWANLEANRPDFLGNEFLMWLWWHYENESDTIQVSDETEITYMLNKTLALECPLGEHGKETISAESPIQLTEALQAVRCGKMPRKSGLTLVRSGQQFDMVLQAESLAVSGAKIRVDEQDDAPQLDDRIDAIRELTLTIDLLFEAYCGMRLSDRWGQTQSAMVQWLASSQKRLRKPAA